jgi:hypothetical protein
MSLLNHMVKKAILQMENQGTGKNKKEGEG